MNMQIRTFTPADTGAVIKLWENCGLTRPWNDPHKDIARKLQVQPGLFLVGEVDGEVMASAMGGYDGHRGTVYYLAIAPAHQKRGYGKQLMTAVEEKLLAMGCPKLNVLVRGTNTQVVEFYQELAYQADDVLSLGKRLIADQ
jgi:ribosomal protein S18 acetylase RimI-like enzyme